MTKPHTQHRRLATETQDKMSHVFENSAGQERQAKSESSGERWTTSRQGKIKINGNHQLLLACRESNVKIKTHAKLNVLSSQHG